MRTANGFTLIELMVVIVIIGILATLAVPKFNDASLKAKVSEGPSVLKTFESAQFAYLAETSSFGVMTHLIMVDPTPATFSKYYTYVVSVSPSANATMAGETKMPVGAATASISSVVNVTNEITHGVTAGRMAQVLPNW